MEVKERFQGGFDVSPISSQDIVRVLNVGETPVVESVLKSTWYSIDDGRIIAEIRDPSVRKRRTGMLQISDFDDTIFSATAWHDAEFQKLADLYGALGLTVEKARQLYNASKIKDEKASGEPRYTPELNIAKVSAYVSFRQAGYNDVQADEKARDVSLNNENAVRSDVRDVFNSNPTLDFVYKDYVSEVFSNSQSDILNVVASRGTIQGVLGQVHKIHSSGVMDEGVQAVIYTNDLKSEVLGLLPNLIPGSTDGMIRILDDNPSEIRAYLPEARRLGLLSLELVMVGHPGAKRRGGMVEEYSPISQAAGFNTQLRSTSFVNSEPFSPNDTTFDIYKPQA